MTPMQFEQLHSGLCAAYPTPAALAFAVRLRLDENSYEIAPYTGKLRTQVLELEEIPPTGTLPSVIYRSRPLPVQGRA